MKQSSAIIFVFKKESGSLLREFMMTSAPERLHPGDSGLFILDYFPLTRQPPCLAARLRNQAQISPQHQPASIPTEGAGAAGAAWGWQD